MARVGVVIVTYRSAPTIDACLLSLTNASSEPLDVVVVDNASDDDSAARAESHGVTVLRRAENAGYGRGCNDGIAALGEVEVVVFANPDTVWPQGSIDALVALLGSDSRLGLVSPVLVDEKGLPQAIVERDLHLLAVLLGMTRLGRPVRPVTPSFVDGPLVDVDWLHTAAAVVPRATVDALGGFDERFFLFAEDADFCRRVRASGQRVVVAANVRVTHIGGASFDASFDRDGSAALRTRALGTYLEKYQGRGARRLFGAVGAVVYGIGRHRGQAREAWKAAKR
ncbi:MAG: glycosyltransferase family 2 protein [Acidimicrobiales bacterium]|nr:glycosyltransferase family 2 protein [Acidimicrobiales bacterium]